MRSRNKRIILCGPYFKHGHPILSKLALLLRGLGFQVTLCSELFPAKKPSSPESIRQATYQCMHAASAYLFVFLSPNTTGNAGDHLDLTGGVGFEYGLLYSRIKSKEHVYIAHLFDGIKYLQSISNLLKTEHWRSNDLVAVMQNPGDIAELKELAVALCCTLDSLLCS